jgi:hypothetical protein
MAVLYVILFYTLPHELILPPAGKAHLELLKSVYLMGRPEIARAAEVAIGAIALPLLCYLWMPAYRNDNFANLIRNYMG